jgi:hypothetical protein
VHSKFMRIEDHLFYNRGGFALQKLATGRPDLQVDLRQWQRTSHRSQTVEHSRNKHSRPIIAVEILVAPREYVSLLQKMRSRSRSTELYVETC